MPLLLVSWFISWFNFFNLDIMENSSTGSIEGTLLERLDQCANPFGKLIYKLV